MTSSEYQNGIKPFSSVSIVTMKLCVQGLAKLLLVFTVTGVKKTEENTDFFRKILYFVLENYDSVFFTVTKNLLCDLSSHIRK